MSLLEKEIPFELVLVDMAKKEHFGPDYLALNPYGRVPTVVDGDFVLYESTAILDYLEALHPEPALVPSSPRERALVSQHIKLCDVEVGSHTEDLIFPSRFVPREKWDLDAMQRARDEIDRHLAILGRALGDGAWLVGGRYSLADLCYTPFAEFFSLLGLSVPTNVAAWTERLLARPSAQATKPDR